MTPLRVVKADNYELHVFGDYVSVGWRLDWVERSMEVDGEFQNVRWKGRAGAPQIHFFVVRDENGHVYLGAPLSIEGGVPLERVEQLRSELQAAHMYLAVRGWKRAQA